MPRRKKTETAPAAEVTAAVAEETVTDTAAKAPSAFYSLFAVRMVSLIIV